MWYRVALCGGVFLFLTSVAVGFIIVSSNMLVPLGKPLPVMYQTLLTGRSEPDLRAGAMLREQIEYLCGDTEISFQGPVPRSLSGSERERLLKQYPEEQGWHIDFQEPDMVTVTQQVDGLCPGHRKYRHLGINDGVVAVFEGPLGYDQRILRVEEHLQVKILPQTLQIKLKQAETFLQQPLETRIILQKELEFTDEQALNVMLENLDELGSGIQLD